MMMFRRTGYAWSVVVSACVGAAALVWAAPTPQGVPPAEHLGKVGYLVHYDGTDWHVEWRSHTKRHRFSGRIVASRDGDLDAPVPVNWNRDIDTLEVDARTIRFTSRLGKGDSKKFTFHTTSTRVMFDLLVDDKRVRRYVLIGRSGLHPDSIPFNLIP